LQLVAFARDVTVTSLPLESRTRVILRRAELGFLGVIVFTWRQTPRFCGQPSSTGDLLKRRGFFRRLRTSWLMVGIQVAFYVQRLERFVIQTSRLGAKRLKPQCCADFATFMSAGPIAPDDYNLMRLLSLPG